MEAPEWTPLSFWLSFKTSEAILFATLSSADYLFLYSVVIELSQLDTSSCYLFFSAVTLLLKEALEPWETPVAADL